MKFFRSNLQGLGKYVSPVTLLAAALLFVINVPTEVQGASWGIWLRMAALAMLMLLLLTRTRVKVSAGVLLAAGLFCMIMLLVNFTAFSGACAYLLVSVAAAVALSASLANVGPREKFTNAVDLVLMAWICLFGLQAFLYFVSGATTDIHNFLFPYSHARLAEVGAGLMRLSGPHIEPGTYANWSYGLVLLRALLGRDPFGLLPTIAMVTVGLTLSFWGALVSAAYFTLWILRRAAGKGFFSKLIGALGVVAIFYLYIRIYLGSDVQNYLMQRSSLADASGASKAYFASVFLSAGWERVIFIGLPLTADPCNGCLSPQDSGIFLNSLVFFGIPFAMALFFLLSKGVWRIHGIYGLLLLMPLIFTKYYVWDPLYWILIGAALPIFRSSRLGPRSADITN